jgi:aminopeptidase S
VQGGYGDDESETGPAGSDSVGRVLVEELAATGVTAELTPFDGGSDFDAFVEAGIPTGGVYTGDEGVKTSEQADRWGGQAGAVFDPCYHAACDRAEGIHRGALDDISDAIAGTLARFAASTDALGLGFANISTIACTAALSSARKISRPSDASAGAQAPATRSTPSSASSRR